MPVSPKIAPEKRCTMCGTRLQRKRYNSQLEGFGAFSRRQFCSLSCANSRSKGGKSRKAYHARARKFRKQACECCGAKLRLHVHHINEDWTNNSPENLQTLCVFCHQFWHATHRRLGLKPSTRMPELPTRWLIGLPAVWDDCAPTEMRSSGRSRRRSSKPSSK